MAKDKIMKNEIINIFSKNKIIFNSLAAKINSFYDYQVNYVPINELNDYAFNPNHLNIFIIPPEYKEKNFSQLKDGLTAINQSQIIFCIDKKLRLVIDGFKNILFLPVSINELIKRINFLKISSIIVFKNLKLNRMDNRLYNNNDSEVILTQIESNIISLLMQSEKQISRNELNLQALGHSQNIDSHSLDSHIYRLRKKLKLISESNQIVTTDSGYY